MKRYLPFLTALLLTASACGPASNNIPATQTPATLPTSSPSSPTPESIPATETTAPMDTIEPPTAIPPAPTPVPIGINVNSFEQEVYPYQADGDCSLAEAITAAQTFKDIDGCVVPLSAAANVVINLTPGTYTFSEVDTTPLSLNGVALDEPQPNALPLISKSVTINGNGSTLRRAPEAPSMRFLALPGFGTLVLNDLTLTGGDTADQELADADGGAIQALGGSVTLNRVSLTGNTAENGGAIEIVGGATVILNDSQVSENIATGEGGGLDVSGTLSLNHSVVSENSAWHTSFGGGGINNDGGEVEITDSRIENNSATEGGGIYNWDESRLTITRSWITGNTASEAETDLPHGGGGINNIGEAAIVSMTDSFLIGNQAPETTGGGVYNHGFITIIGSVIATNVGGRGGGLFNDTEGELTISQSCFLENSSTQTTPAHADDAIYNVDPEFALAVQAADNWWGAADGPGNMGNGSGNTITRNVEYDPALTAPPALCADGIPPIPTLVP